MRYKLTNRGKWIIRLLLLAFASGMIFSGMALVPYFIDTDDMDNMSLENNLILSPETTYSLDSQIPQSEKPPSKSDLSQIQGNKYTPYELDDLKMFKMDLIIEKGSVNLSSSHLKDLNYLLDLLKNYPKEPLTVEYSDHQIELAKAVNQYLNEGKTGENEIELKKLDDHLALVSSETKINVITIYFTNHYSLAKNSK